MAIMTIQMVLAGARFVTLFQQTRKIGILEKLLLFKRGFTAVLQVLILPFILLTWLK